MYEIIHPPIFFNEIFNLSLRKFFKPNLTPKWNMAFAI
jgi:hypothetical protein